MERKAWDAFWASLGFEIVFETDHGSGQWQHRAGGPHVFIAEQQGDALKMYPVVEVAEAGRFESDRTLAISEPFTPRHWGVVEAFVRDPEGRDVSLQAPLPDGAAAPDADEHHREKYGST